jgi:hypothetical protein
MIAALAVLPTQGGCSITHVFQSFWYGESLSPYEKMCMRSFLDHGHSFCLYSYSQQIEIPPRIQLRNAAEILDQGEYFTYKSGPGAGSHAAFSNLFRYKLLAERGGWWVDTDVVCLSGDVPHFDQFFANQTDELVNGAVLFFKAGDPLMLDCLDEAWRIGDCASWGDIGPRLITRKAKEHGRIGSSQSRATCYPIHFTEALDLLRPSEADSISERTRESFFLHLWNEVLRRVNVSKTMLPPRGSYLRTLADRHPVGGWYGEYDVDVFERLVSLETELQRLRKEMNVLRNQQQKMKAKTAVASESRRSQLAVRLRAAEKALVSLAHFLKR